MHGPQAAVRAVSEQLHGACMFNRAVRAGRARQLSAHTFVCVVAEQLERRARSTEDRKARRTHRCKRAGSVELVPARIIPQRIVCAVPCTW